MNKVAAAPAAAEDDEEQEEQTTLTHIESEQETAGEGEGGGEGSGAAHVRAKLRTAYIFKVLSEQSLNATQPVQSCGARGAGDEGARAEGTRRRICGKVQRIHSFVPLKKLGWKQGEGPARHLRAVLKNVWL